MTGWQKKKTKTLEWAKTLEQFVQGFRMETSEGTVFGQTYYCVKPVGWIWREFEWKDMKAWCEETLGPEGHVHHTGGEMYPEADQRWYANGEQFWFRDEKDRTMFVLRWV